MTIGIAGAMAATAAARVGVAATTPSNERSGDALAAAAAPVGLGRSDFSSNMTCAIIIPLPLPPATPATVLLVGDVIPATGERLFIAAARTKRAIERSSVRTEQKIVTTNRFSELKVSRQRKEEKSSAILIRKKRKQKHEAIQCANAEMQRL
jgi:hypothetical protein